jgi:hypothetical protein
MPTTTTRTLVQTTTAGWYLDTADPDGKRVRKTDDDVILTLQDYEALKAGNLPQPESDEEQRQRLLDMTGEGMEDQIKAMTPDEVRSMLSDMEDLAAAAPQIEVAAAAIAAERTRQDLGAQLAQQAAAPVIGANGKPLSGPTCTIRCSWIADDEDAPDVSFEDLTPAQQAKACGAERTIKVQDQFQVKRCAEHQGAHRRRVTRQKARAKRAAAQAK